MRHTPPFRYPPELPTSRGPDKPLLIFLALVTVLALTFAGFCIAKMIQSAPVAAVSEVAA